MSAATGLEPRAVEGGSAASWVEQARQAIQAPIQRLARDAARLNLLRQDADLAAQSGDLQAICDATALLTAEFGRCMTLLAGSGRDEALIARLRHDLRTPLNAIRGYAELLLEEGDADALRGHLRELLAHSDDVLAAIADQLIGEGGATTGAAEPRRAPIEPVRLAALGPVDRSQPGRILVVDDNAANRDVLSRRLAREGHAVIAVEDGDGALARLAAQPFDLVLLDFEMPGLKGIEVLERMKSQPGLASIPVVMISAGTDVRRIASCLECGAEDYVAKPFDPIVLRARIGACLEKKRLRERSTIGSNGLAT